MVTMMQPMLIKAITVTIWTSTKQIVTDIIRDKCVEEVNELKRVIQEQSFEFDKLRDKIRVNGIPETGGENTNEIVRAFAADIGVTITTDDISISHRMPGRPRTAKSILAKFVRRDMKVCGRDHITPVLKKLHWLPVKQRVTYQIILPTFRALNGLAPIYIVDMLHRH